MKKMAMEQRFYAQVVIISQKDLKLIAEDTN